MPQPWELLPPIAGGEEDDEDAEVVELRYHKYLFFIHGPRPFETSEMERTLRSSSSDFGKALGKDGRVVRIYPEHADANLARTANLSWPDGLGTQIRETTDPFLLIIGVDRAKFDPTNDDWAIIWLSDHDHDKLYQLFTTLARITRDEKGDLFGYLEREARKRKAKRVGKKFADVVELKPSFFGITLNLNALLQRDDD
jgi:hypothetical protein